ncbi:MAG: HTH-type transcriptional activator IlvY [Thiolinea sp.]
MNIRTLEHFLTLAERLHFGRASEASHISISALSRHIRQLEQELGATLFHRDNRTVSLTAEGKRFQQYAREATAQWKMVCHDLADQAGELHGEISVYCSVTASYSILFDLLNRFRDDYPGIEIKLHTGDPEHAIARVLAGEEEISIAAHPGTLPANVAFKPVTVSPLLFIAPVETSDPALQSLPPLSAQAWAGVPMILAEDGIARQRSDAWFRALGVTPKIYAQVAGNEAIVSMVSLGLGVGVVPQIVLDHSPMVDRIQVLNVEPALEPYHVGLFTLKRHLKNPLVAAFWGITDFEGQRC